MSLDLKNNEKIWVLALVLFVITAVVALLLGLTNQLTADKIAERQELELTEARQAVMPDADAFTKVEGSFDETVSEVYAATKGGETVGYCVSVNPNGFGGPIGMVVGVSLDNTVEGVTITSLSETPGLGSKAQDEAFYGQYVGKQADSPLAVIKSGSPADNEIVAISGATITSAAVTNGVNTAVETAKSLK